MGRCKARREQQPGGNRLVSSGWAERHICVGQMVRASGYTVQQRITKLKLYCSIFSSSHSVYLEGNAIVLVGFYFSPRLSLSWLSALLTRYGHIGAISVKSVSSYVQIYAGSTVTQDVTTFKHILYASVLF